MQQRVVLEAKPKFTALQNIEKLFKDKPVVTHEKHRIRLEDIAHTKYEEEKTNPGHLFKQLMASINPFASYVIEEAQQRAKSGNVSAEQEKLWTLEQSLFKNPAPPIGQTQEQRLHKNSSEMFVIYKFVNDPLIKVKSEKYTGLDEHVQIKDLFPVKSLLQTSPINVQL